MKTNQITQDNSAIAATAGIGHNKAPEPTTIEELKSMPAELVYDLSVDKIVGLASAEASIDEIDLSTATGRALIKSKAHEISKLKTNLVDKGLKLTEGWRAETKKVNAIKGELETRLDALRDSIREPVTKWEEANQAREKAHQDAFKAVQDMMLFPAEICSSDVECRIEMLKLLSERDWQEFEASAKAEIDKVSVILNDKLTSVRKAEADAIELEQLRQAAAIQKQKEQEAENARIQAAKDKQAEDDRQALIEKTRKDTEARLAKEREEAEQKRKNILEGGILTMKNLLQGASELPSVVIAARQVTVTNTYNSISDWQEYAKEAENVRDNVFDTLVEFYTINLKKEDDERAKRQKEIELAAAQKERERQEAEAAREQAELEKREANKKHVAKINKEAATDIVEATGIDFGDALAIVQAIAEGKIRNAQINY